MARIGIHTRVPDPNNARTMHAWISTTRDGQVSTYSSYPDDNDRAHLNGQSNGWNGSGTHVRKDVDLDQLAIATASRYIDLNAEQEARLVQALKQPENWTTLDNNCAHFSARAWHSATGNS